MTDKREVYEKFRLSIDNGFRNAFSYVHYRKWGVMELWEAGRYASAPPERVTASMTIDIWFNWERVGSFKSYDMARGLVNKLRKTAPVSLHGLEQYLEI